MADASPSVKELDIAKIEAGVDGADGHDATERSGGLRPEAQSGLHLKRGQSALRLEIPNAQFNPPLSSQQATASKEKDREPASAHAFPVKFPRKPSIPLPDLSWIPNNLKLSRLRSVFRCATGAWISVLLVLIPSTQRVLGKSSFLILVATFLSPPCDPFIAVLEREIILQVTVAGAFAWSCLGIWLANLTRRDLNVNASQEDISSGRYIEPAPSIICAVFLCVGTSILLYLRTRMGQGKPVTATMILSCTAMDSALTTAPLYPFPNYSTGKNAVVPIAFHSAIAVLVSLLIFPESVHGQFRRRFHAVFDPLAQALRSQPELLCMGTAPEQHSAVFDAALSLFEARIRSAESALAALRKAGRLMEHDVAFGRFAADDFRRIHALARRMTVRAHGMAFYFNIMDPSRHRFRGALTPGARTPLLATTPAHSPPGSAPPTPGAGGPTHNAHADMTGSSAYNFASRSPTGSIASRRRRRRTTHSPVQHLFQHLPFHGHSHSHKHAHGASLFAPDMHSGHALAAPSEAGAVGVFESQAYLDLEARFAHAGADALRARAMGLLGADACAGMLLRAAGGALVHCGEWVERVDDDRLLGRILRRLKRRFGKEKGKVRCEEVVLENEEVKARLNGCLDEFRREKRHLVLSMYRPTIDPNYPGTPSGEEPPPHRYLFQCYLYQYHLIQFVQDLIELLDEISRLESTRQHRRLWLPLRPFQELFGWSGWDAGDEQYESGEGDDEDPDIVFGMGAHMNVLALGGRRDPDALPPRNTLERVARAIYVLFCALGRGNCVFAFKAGVMAALLSLPAFLPSSAPWALDNRYVWALVPGQTTLSRFRGDTVFGLISRVLSTFFGGLTGLAMWYISSGRGTGNAFGLAAVTAVCFPFFFFARIYYPGPPIDVAFFFLTSQLVIGYSWQDTHLPSAGGLGFGVKVAWERFMLVTIGVFVAFVFSFLPPSTTLRRYLRTTCATTASQLGQLYCDVLSVANVRDRAKTDEIAENLVAVRMKLNRTAALRKNVAFEVVNLLVELAFWSRIDAVKFSLQGRWPAERYKRVLDIQLEMAYLLSHLRSVEEHLDPQWSRAFLRRTRFMEPEFQGDILSVFCMISIALRTGAPLPQITPCPLLDRFVAHQHPNLHPHHASFHAHDHPNPHASNSSSDEYGLPRSLTIDILEDEQYLYFSVGVATAFGIITRLDRLMHAAKELVGEQYHIHSVVDLLGHKRNEEKLYL